MSYHSRQIKNLYFLGKLGYCVMPGVMKGKILYLCCGYGPTEERAKNSRGNAETHTCVFANIF